MRPFLTAVDEARLKIRGSRDPLGLVPLWSHFGRRVVGNLTTATTSVRGFTSTLLGLYLAEKLNDGGRNADEQRLRVFLQVEQLCGYARWKENSDSDLRGIREVQRRLEEQDSIVIAADSGGQILANQKTYGLWGLYTDPSRNSGFIEQDTLILTSDARTQVETFIVSSLNKAGVWPTLQKILKRERFSIEPDGRDRALLSALGRVLVPRLQGAEREWYRSHLVLGRRGRCHVQETLATLVERRLPKGEEFSHEHLRVLIAEARAQKHDELAEYLEDIRDLEGLLIPLADLFSFLQSRDGALLSTAVDEVRKEWSKGLRHINVPAILRLRPLIQNVYSDAQATTRFAEIAVALKEGDVGDAIHRCLEHNAFVMQARGGAQPWVVVSNKRLDVRYRDNDGGGLEPAKVLATAWRSGFYINPLKRISDQLRAA